MNDYKRIAKLYKTDYGNPIILKQGQVDIFNTIVEKKRLRSSVLAYTQYGKSMVIALGVLMRAVLYPETWAIVAPTKDKTMIVMRHIIQHLFDDHFFYSQLEVDVALERLKREKRRDHLTFRRGGRIYCITAEARNRRRIGQSLLGAGAGNVILDESPLITDQLFSFVTRMMGGTASNFLVQVGNAFERNHFFKSFRDDKYHNIVIDCYKGLEESKLLPYNEGKLTQEFLDEQRGLPFFEQLYECKFPDISLIDEKGYTLLLTENAVKNSFKARKEISGKPKLGVDVGRGGDYTVFLARWSHYAKKLEKNRDPDLMAQVARIERYKEELEIEDPADIFVDDIGVGSGVSDRCWEKDIPVTKVVAGAKPLDDTKFVNVKAEAFWEAKMWVEAGNQLEEDNDFYQLVEIKYKEDSERKLKIEPKEDCRARLGYSPDAADAFMLTFAKQETKPELFVL